MKRQIRVKQCAAVLVFFGGLVQLTGAFAEQHAPIVQAETTDNAGDASLITPLPATIPARVRTIVLTIPEAKTPVRRAATLDSPIHIVTSCKREPFVKYEKDARAGIDKAWRDTQDGRYGYGFSNRVEYEKWREALNDVFTSVAAACEGLSTCAKRAGGTAKRACAWKARSFSGWQETGKQFLVKVKTMETGMAPSLCAVTPAFSDLSECFSRLAERIDTACDKQRCQEVSQCWRSVAFLDQAIRQAESACGFAGQDLNTCRGYVEATGRREAKFAQCQSAYKSARIGNFPVL